LAAAQILTFAEERLQFAAIFKDILDKQKDNLDHSDGKCTELRMYMFIVGNELHSAFPNTEIPFEHTCARWFQTVLQSGLFLSCLDLRIIF